MTIHKRRAFHLVGASWLIQCAISNSALAEDAAAPSSSTQLPEITVTAPSPIVRHRTVPSRTPTRVARAAPGRNRERAAAPAPAAPTTPPAPQQGVLPVVTDQFATVTVIPNEELRRAGSATLGDSCSPNPASPVRASPGASSRRIIRGLDVNRVGIVETAPAAARPTSARITSYRSIRLRQPGRGGARSAALRYGSTSIGGVVSATNNRIPDAMPTRGGAQSYGLPVKKAPWQMRDLFLHERRDPNGGEFGRSQSRRHCSMPVRTMWRFMPTPTAARRATTTSRAIRICSTRPGR
jgi:iron complex outermembrane receptor protein